MSVSTILFDLGTGGAGKPVHFKIVECKGMTHLYITFIQITVLYTCMVFALFSIHLYPIVEAYVNHVIQSSVWAIHILPGYTIHKGFTVQCYQELINLKKINHKAIT